MSPASGCGITLNQPEDSMDDPRSATDATGQAPLLQRLYDSPFVLLLIGLVVMLVLFTFWGLWEVMSLPTAPLP